MDTLAILNIMRGVIEREVIDFLNESNQIETWSAVELGIFELRDYRYHAPLRAMRLRDRLGVQVWCWIAMGSPIEMLGDIPSKLAIQLNDYRDCNCRGYHEGGECKFEPCERHKQ